MFYERVKDEMYKSFPTVANSQKEFLDIVGELIIYLLQGINIIIVIHKYRIYFGDFKPQYLLVSFVGYEIIFGDFGMDLIL